MGCFIQSLLTIFGVAITPEQCPVLSHGGYPDCTNPFDSQFDFIIVGSGPAGCALANRLSEINEWNVLLIEAGGYPSATTQIPAAGQFLQQTEEDWSFVSQPSEYFGAYQDNSIHIPQGHVLGGSSSINGMFHLPGSPFDYDSWGDLVDASWSWRNVAYYFNRVNEHVKTWKYVSPRKGHVVLARAARELNIDVNGPTALGYKDVPLNIINNTRLSMARAYLKPIVDRQNFCLLVDTLVSKIVIENGNAVGVEIDSESEWPIVIKARNEVIVTAGPLNSAKLLMLSGIGPQDHLEDLQISLVKHLPVGQNMQDHMHVPIYIELPDKNLLNVLATSSLSPQIALLAYCLTGEILNNEDIASFIGFFNTNNDTSHPNIEFVHAQSIQGDTYLLDTYLRNAGFKQKHADYIRDVNQRVEVLITLLVLLKPKSNGHMLLRDRNPSSPPMIYPNYFENEDDIELMMQAFNQFKRLKNTDALRNNAYLKFDIENCNGFVFMSPDYMRCYFKTFVSTTYHLTGTCRMGREESTSVVDSRLKVHGVGKLRVGDSSVMPEIISGHTSIPSCMIAEKLSDIIKADYLS